MAEKLTSLSSETQYKLDRVKTEGISVRDTLERVAEKFKAPLEAKRTNNSIEDVHCKGKILIPSSLTSNSSPRVKHDGKE